MNTNNNFVEKVYVTDLKKFSKSLRFFMEKVYRKYNDKATMISSYL